MRCCLTLIVTLFLKKNIKSRYIKIIIYELLPKGKSRTRFKYIKVAYFCSSDLLVALNYPPTLVLYTNKAHFKIGGKSRIIITFI